MRCVSTALGAWASIEGARGSHGITFPLALVHAEIELAGLPAPVHESEDTGEMPPDAYLISVMDSRHMWAIPGWLRGRGVAPLASERSASDPLVIAGGQACYAPAPIEELVDLVWVGEAEAGLGRLMRELAATIGQPKLARLERVAGLPGVLVPDVTPSVRAVYAEEWGASHQRRLQVNLRPLWRMELARGCRGPAKSTVAGSNAACGFCALGWRAPYREAPVRVVEDALDRCAESGVREVHLSAGDAEGYSEIGRVRARVAERGLVDTSWTGRLDTMSTDYVGGSKTYAFGVEGASWRLRRAVGKARLTDDYVIERLAAYWAAGGTRCVLHLISRLPTEGAEDLDEFGVLLRRIERAIAATRRPLHTTLAVQPFGPLPHTPLQWFAPGLRVDPLARLAEGALRRPRAGRAPWAITRGQRYAAAVRNAVVMRGGREVTPALVAGRLPADVDRYLAAWPIGSSTPWDHVEVAHSALVEDAARRIARLLGEAA